MNNSLHTSAGSGLIRAFSNTLVKLLVLNILTFFTYIPIITIGAALSAMQDCLLKIVRKTDGEIVRPFFRSFQTNLKQATLLWLPFLLIFAATLADILSELIAPEVLPDYIAVPAFSAAMIAFLLFQFVMPLQAHFNDSSPGILHSAAVLSVAHLPETFLMALLWVLPVVLFFQITLSWPLLVLFGISLPGYLCARLYHPIFLILENQSKQNVRGEC